MRYVVCNNCGAKYDLNKDYVPADLKCPQCGHDLRVSGIEDVEGTDNPIMAFIALFCIIIFFLINLIVPFIPGMILSMIFGYLAGYYLKDHYLQLRTTNRIIVQIFCGMIFFLIFIAILTNDYGTIKPYDVNFVALLTLLFAMIGITLGLSRKFMSRSFSMSGKVASKKLLDQSVAKLDNENLSGLDDIVGQLEDLENIRIYNDLAKEINFTKMRDIEINKREYGALKLGGAVFGASMGIISFQAFESMYVLLEGIYKVIINRTLLLDDYDNIYFSGLDRFLLFYQDKFDEVSQAPQITPEFLWNLKKIKWENSDAKNLYRKLSRTKYSSETLYSGYFHVTFYNIENQFIKLMAGCSALKNQKTGISKEDIVIAYQTYFKLLKTDFTRYKTKAGFIYRDITDKEDKKIKELQRSGGIFDRISWIGIFTGFLVLILVLRIFSRIDYGILGIFFTGPFIGGIISGYKGLEDYPDGIINGFLVSFLLCVFVLVFFLISVSFHGSFGDYSLEKIIISLSAMLAAGAAGGLSGVIIKKLKKILFPEKADPRLGKGFLVCDKCEGYYELQPWESPDDFDKCQCGGNLEYHEYMDFLPPDKAELST